MRILVWNIQWCQGMDGILDPGRIAAETRRLADPDIACFQEVADNYPELAGSRGENQAAALGRELQGYELVYGFGVDVDAPAGGRRRFGNLVASRFPVRRVLRHILPWPAYPALPSMPRVAVEAQLETPLGPLRVTTTHLEYYSGPHRPAQVERLRELHAEACGHAARASPERPDSGPFLSEPRASTAIVCGDFNLRPEDPLHARMLAPFPDGSARLIDAWDCAHPGEPHAPTFRLHDRARGEPPYCCDYVFVTEDLAPRVLAFRVDAATLASDHQPLIVEFAT